MNAVATFNRFPLRNLVADGFLITLILASVFLFPWRLALTACQEAHYFVERTINRIGHYLAPNNRVVQTFFSALSVVAWIYLILQYLVPYFSLKMLLNFQLFPEAWSLTFILATSLTCSALELAAGIVLGVKHRITGYYRVEPVQNELDLDEQQRQAGLRLSTQLDPNIFLEEEIEEEKWTPNHEQVSSENKI